MPVRKYWRHMLGVQMAITFTDQPREVMVSFINHFCETRSDGEASELVESKNKLKTEFENFKSKKS